MNDIASVNATNSVILCLLKLKYIEKNQVLSKLDDLEGQFTAPP